MSPQEVLARIREWAERGVALVHLSDDDPEAFVRAKASAEVLAILDGHDD